MSDDSVNPNVDPIWPWTPNPQTGGTTTSLPIPGSGNSNTASGTTSTGNGSTVTSTGGGTWSVSNGGIYSTSVTLPKPIVKDKIAYIIVQKDGTKLIMEEQNVLTPQEMIGISKFLSVVAATLTAVSQAAQMGYNLQINWSQIIKDLAIERHFVQTSIVPGAATNVLELLLYDPV